MPTRKNLQTGATVVEVEGSSYTTGSLVADNDIKPLLLGGEVDENLDTYATGSLQALKLDSQRNLATFSRAYDAPTDADRIVPVVSPYDNFEPLDFSNLVATLALTSYYWDADTFPYWSLLLSTSTAAATIEVKIYASNDAEEPDITLRDYTDITTDVYGDATISLTSVTSEAIIVDTPTLFNSYKITFDSDIAAVWTAKGKQGAI